MKPISKRTKELVSKIKLLLEQKKKGKEIARELNVSLSTVDNIKYRFGLKSCTHTKKYTEEERTKVEQLLQKNVGIEEIAKFLERATTGLVLQCCRVWKFRKRFPHLLNPFIKKYREEKTKPQTFIKNKLNAARRRNWRKDRKNIECNIDYNFLIEQFKKQQNKCYYSGLAISFRYNDPYAFSLDRLDSQKGYTRDNVVICCNFINDCKRSLSDAQFIFMCNLVSQQHKDKNLEQIQFS